MVCSETKQKYDSDREYLGYTFTTYSLAVRNPFGIQRQSPIARP